MVWDLANALSEMGHRVHLLAAEGTTCSFAEVSFIDPRQSLKLQIPKNIDLVHFHNRPDFDPDVDFLPYLYTQHGNETAPRDMPINSVFVSENHARRFGADQFVHNGLDDLINYHIDLHTMNLEFLLPISLKQNNRIVGHLVQLQ